MQLENGTICEYSCVRPNTLKRHQQTHTGEKSHICGMKLEDGTICDYSCIELGNLKIHQLTHTGDKPYICDVELEDGTKCGERFRQSQHLKYHYESSHTVEGIQRRYRKQRYVERCLREEGFITKWERLVHIRCSIRDDNETKLYAKLDILVITDRAIFIVEVDEDQHSGRWFNYCIKGENRRMMDVVSSIRMTGDEQPLVWIRYNPDSYTVNGERPKRFKNGGRAGRLIELLHTYKPKAPVEIVYMFYDVVEENGKMIPAIFQDKDYDHFVKKLVTECHWEVIGNRLQ